MNDATSHYGEFVVPRLVYLVDGDATSREEMVVGLSRLGLQVAGFPSAAALYRAIAAAPADIVILEMDLPGEDGLAVASHLHSGGSVGVIFATTRASVEDRVKGLKAGADAYLTKPVDVEELAAVVVAVARRIRASTLAASVMSGWSLIEGGWVLTDAAGNRLCLTGIERQLIRRLLQERGRVVSRGAIVEALGKDIYDFNYAYLDTIISRLRQRAKKAGMTLPLHAVRGEGLAFAG